MELITKEKLMELPTSNYDKRARKEFEEKITLLNKELPIARSNNERKYVLEINAITDAATDMINDALTKAGYIHELHYHEEDCPYNYIEVKW